MTRIFVRLAGCSALLLVSTALLAQPPGGGDRGRGGFGGGPPGGGPDGGMRMRGGDPDFFFNMMSKGKDVIIRSELDERGQRMFDGMTQRFGITGDRMTRDQFKTASEQFRSRMGGGGPPTAVTTTTTAGAPADTDRGAEDRFWRYDKNGDGLISIDEMSGGLRDVWQQYDANKDGAISLEEYKA